MEGKFRVQRGVRTGKTTQRWTFGVEPDLVEDLDERSRDLLTNECHRVDVLDVGC